MIAFANSSLPANRHISVQGTAEVLVEPDMAKILFKVNSVKNEPNAANNALENKVKLLILVLMDIMYIMQRGIRLLDYLLIHMLILQGNLIPQKIDL